MLIHVAVTGHRPQRLGGFSPNNPLMQAIKTRLSALLSQLHDHGFEVIGISGMALGVDQAFARACLALSIPFHAYIPFPGQERIWPTHSQLAYQRLLGQASACVVVCHEALSSHDVRRALLARNSAMVADAQAAIAIWDGSPGGTADAVRKFRAANRPLLMLHPHRLCDDKAVKQWIVAIHASMT